MGKRTIDRRRRPKGLTPATHQVAAAKRQDSDSDDDSSLDAPTRNEVAKQPKNQHEFDSSADEMMPWSRSKKKAPLKQDSTHDDSHDEELHSDDSETEHARAFQDSSEDEAPSLPKRKKQTARSKKTPKRKKVTMKKHQVAPKGRKKKAPESDDDEEYESEASAGEESSASEFDPDEKDDDAEQSDESEESWNGEDEKPKAKRGRPKKAATKQGKGRQTPARGRKCAATRRRKESDSEESWDSDTEQKKRNYKTPRRGRRSSREVQQHDSSDEEHEEDVEDDSPRRSTPSRRSATRALEKISDNVQLDEKPEDDDDDEPSDLYGAARKSRRKKKRDDDDEEFDPDAEEQEEQEDDDDEFDEDASDDARDDKYEAGNVDAQQDLFTADSSDDENATGPSPMLDVKSKPASRSRRRTPVKQDSDSFASSDSEQELADQNDDQKPAFSSYPHMPDCPSEVDAITMDPLPEKHLCYFPPDGQSRQCFALETLHKIALSSSVRGPDGKVAFLQPPHFRSVASDDFIDQIASRFGRSALDLTGDFYNRGRLANDDGYMLTFGANLADEETFRERLNDYISNHMGSQDICCCPLCYIECHRRLANRLSGEEADSEDDDPSEPGEDENEPIKLWHDPMTVLGYPDSEEYGIASMFCFSKMADVKRHLREAHNVDTKVLANNDMFARFKIRAGDGLLQRYIDKIKHRKYQGDMRRYWNLGNNQTFVFLLHLMKRRAARESPTLEASAQDFYESFENRARRTWEAVSAPYRKATKEELNEFIEDGDVEEEDPQPHFAMQRELNDMNPEDEIVEALRTHRRMSQGGGADSSDSDSSDSSVEIVGGPSREEDESEEEEEVDPRDIPGYYSEEEEDNDEWVTSKLARPGRRNKVSPTAASDPSKRVGKILGKKKREGQLKQDPDSQDGTQSPPTKKAKRRVIVDSDED